MHSVFIDCDAQPAVPRKLQLVDNRPIGIVEWDPAKVVLLPLDPNATAPLPTSERDIKKEMVAALSDDPGLCQGMWKPGTDLLASVLERAWQMGGRPLNALALDYLLEHPELIPNDWERKIILFVNTKYKGNDDFSASGYTTMGVRTLQTSWYSIIVDDFKELSLITKLLLLVGLPFWTVMFLVEGRQRFVEGTIFPLDDALRFLDNHYVPVYIP